MFTGELTDCQGDHLDTDERGLHFAASLMRDDDNLPPWEHSDGHGPVSEWTTRDKRAGELELSDDRGSFRYYHYSEACRIALKDGWGTRDGRQTNESRRAYAARAAKEDYEWLRAWCQDEWFYVGVIVRCYAEGIQLSTASLWGIESNAGPYLTDVANQLLPECEREARAKLMKLCQHTTEGLPDANN